MPPESSRGFELAISRLDKRAACRLTVKLLALAHEENCEAALATEIDDCLRARRLPDLDRLKARFAPDRGGMPRISVIPARRAGYRVLFTRTTDLVQRLQVARRDLTLENLLAKLDRYHLVILDDFAYVRKDQAETSVLFELISVRYERRSLLITANQPFGEWHKVFPDETTAVAAVDRLVHRATILEMNVESYRRRAAIEESKRKRGRPASRATTKNATSD